jgi:hypothetical protein
MPTKKRIDAIDFWRGLVLVFIFIDHIPGNILENITPRNFGFSDSAEAFVFLSGMSVVLAYSRRLATEGASAGSLPIVKRAMRLYVVHVLLTFLGLALVFTAVQITQSDAIVQDADRMSVLTDPLHTLPAIFTLTHQISYFNILPLYVVLMLFAPIYLLIGMRSRYAMLALSAAVYAAARIFDINLPSWPIPGGWYFDPLCWQFMFAIGIFVGLTLRAEPIPQYRPIFWVCVVYSFVTAVVVSNAFGFAPGLVDKAGHYLDWVKSDLGTVRIFDFLAHAYVISQLPLTRLLKSTVVYSPLTLLGRHSLFAFCVLTLLSILGQILKETWIDSSVFDVFFVSAGLFGLNWIVRHLEWQSAPHPQSTAAE